MTDTTTAVVGGEVIDATEAINIYQGTKSILVLVIAKSGRGKSTAMRRMNPDNTYLINVLGKPLPFPKGMQWQEKKNMTVTTDSATVVRVMNEVSKAEKEDKTPRWNNLVIDDGHYIMATEFMNKAMEKGYDKFTMMAKNIFNIVSLATKLRPGLKVFFLTHEEDTGTERKIKTLGKLLDEKITLEGLSSIVLFGEVQSENDKRSYFFSTQSDGSTTAKSPFDMFPNRIPNDLQLISDRLDEYYSGVELKKSKLDYRINVF